MPDLNKYSDLILILFTLLWVEYIVDFEEMKSHIPTKKRKHHINPIIDSLV